MVNRPVIISFVTVLWLGLSLVSCGQNEERPLPEAAKLEKARIEIGAERFSEYLREISGKKVALVVNQTSVVGKTHLVDTLLSLGIDVKTIFAPEHGFRGEASAGEHLKDEKDQRTGLPVTSLYGKKKKPAASDLQGLDWVIFDIQDVGARFYTYISTLHLVMEACAENGVKLMVLDRPNPNGFYVDGPVLEPGFSSFVGMDPIPVVHGLTVGEYAMMCNGEGWLNKGIQCELNVVTCKNYDHSMAWELAIPPSPNLRSPEAILLYPSLCFFEPTVVSIGRGTDDPFTVVGYPNKPGGEFRFRPVSLQGASSPKHEGKECIGVDLKDQADREAIGKSGLRLDWLFELYKEYPDKGSFFTSSDFFDKLAGTDKLRNALIAGKTVEEVRVEWQDALNDFKIKRQKYLLYPDFQ